MDEHDEANSDKASKPSSLLDWTPRERLLGIGFGVLGIMVLWIAWLWLESLGTVDAPARPGPASTSAEAAVSASPQATGAPSAAPSASSR